MKMARYYIGSKERLTIKSIHFYGGTKKIITERTTIKKDILYHQNRVGVLIETESGKTPPNYDEAREYLEYLTSNTKSGIGTTCEFVDTTALVPTTVTKNEVKQLRKAYKTRRYN